MCDCYKLSVAFKGIGNSSNKLVSALNGDKAFLTNSYGGLQRDIAAICQNYNVVYMFGLDKKLKGTIRIEKSAVCNNEIISSELDMDAFARALSDTGIIAKIGTHPRQSLCNDAYWHMLKKFHGQVVFFHIPSVKYLTEDYIANITTALYA